MAESLIPEYTESVALDLEHRRKAIRQKILSIYKLRDEDLKRDTFFDKIEDILKPNEDSSLGKKIYGNFVAKLHDFARCSHEPLTPEEKAVIQSAAKDIMYHYVDAHYLADKALDCTMSLNPSEKRFANLIPKKTAELGFAVVDLYLAQITWEALSRIKAAGKFSDNSALRLVGSLIRNAMNISEQCGVFPTAVKPQIPRSAKESEAIKKISDFPKRQYEIIKKCYREIEPKQRK